ncbi:MAG: class II glutamine amidotransferase, partial [Proteobacteria bacterium]|nr:class II glutamine amidotransferase [Pseudomonadota bacterium]
MCGIVGVLANSEVSPLLLKSLRLLEYRGYDSAGIATVTEAGIERRRTEGKIAALEAMLSEQPLSGRTGIAHTRWATHGVPAARNAHPHSSGPVSVVHNGIIENYLELRQELLQQGFHFSSETDTEVIAHLINHELRADHDPRNAFWRALRRLEG